MQAAGAGMDRRLSGRSRDQHSDDRETDSLKAAEGRNAGRELFGEKTRTFTGPATLPTKVSFEDTSSVWRRIRVSAIRGGSSSASSP